MTTKSVLQTAGDGTTIPSGYVGEVLTATIAAVTLTTSLLPYNVATLTLSAGVWMVYGKMAVGSAGTTRGETTASISTTSATENFKNIGAATASNINYAIPQALPTVVSVSASTSIYLVGKSDFTGTAPVTQINFTNFYAIRIA